MRDASSTSSGRVLGIALYHHVPIERVANKAKLLLTVLLRALPTLQRHDRTISPTTSSTLNLKWLFDTLGDANTPLIFSHRDARCQVILRDPESHQPRAVAPFRSVWIVPAELNTWTQNLWRATFLALADALDVEYGLMTTCARFDHALDETYWPAGPYLSTTPGRRHTDAWIHLMRSFGRPHVGEGIPDLYWGNIVGRNIVNTLRGRDRWDTLEEIVQTQYLPRGAVAFWLSDTPPLDDAPHHTPQALALQDLLAPLHLIQHPLEQAQQGDMLLIESLSQSGDLRLLPSLAHEDTLDAFRTLANVDDTLVETLADARQYLADHIDQRPRGYHETPPPPSRTHEPPPEITTDTPPDPTTTSTRAHDATDSASATWIVSPTHPGSVRITRVTFDRDSVHITLRNTLSCTLQHVALQALSHRSTGDVALFTSTTLGELTPQDTHTLTLTLDTLPDDAVTVQWRVRFAYHARVALNAPTTWPVANPTLPLTATWPAHVEHFAPWQPGHPLHCRVIHTGLEPWLSWRLILNATQEHDAPPLAIDGPSGLLPGQDAWLTQRAAHIQHLADAPAHLEVEAAASNILIEWRRQDSHD